MGQRPFHSGTWRPLYWEMPGGTFEGRQMTPRFCQRRHKSRLHVRHQKGLCMIVVSHIMRMPMQSPDQVLFKTMRMPVISNHLRVFLQGLKHLRHMRGHRRKGPDNKSKTCQGSYCLPKTACDRCPRVHHLTVPLFSVQIARLAELPPEHRFLSALQHPPWGDNFSI